MRNYVNFRGRARRREFWMFTLFNTLVYLLLLAVGLVLLGAVIYKSVAEGGDAAEHATAYTLAVAGLLLLVYGWMLATFLPGVGRAGASAARHRAERQMAAGLLCALLGLLLLDVDIVYAICRGRCFGRSVWTAVGCGDLDRSAADAAGIGAVVGGRYRGDVHRFRERGESVWRRSHGGSSGGGRRGCGVCYGSFNLKSIAYEMVVDLY